MEKKHKTICIKEGFKFCGRCSCVKPHSEFYTRKLLRGRGLTTFCCDCIRYNSNRYYHQSNARRLEIIQKVIARRNNKHN